MIIRVCGVHITNPWACREAAHIAYPGSAVNARKWMRVKFGGLCPDSPRVAIGSAASNDQQYEFVRQSKIAHGTQFDESRHVIEFQQRKA